MPYTLGLLRSLPRREAIPGALEPIPGNPPDNSALPSGCAFAPRCEHRIDHCEAAIPGLVQAAPGRLVRCLRWQEIEARPVPAGERQATASPTPVALDDPYITVSGLSKYFPLDTGLFSRAHRVVRAVDHVDLTIGRGEVLGLVGESGSGKRLSAVAC